MASESQSRYSIVERLTDRKLDLITAKARLEDDVARAQQRVVDAKKALSDWETDNLTETERQKRKLERDIARAETEEAQLKESLPLKRETFDSKLSAVETALKAVEEISRSAATQEKS